MVWLQKWRFERKDIKTTSSKRRKIGIFFIIILFKIGKENMF